MVGYHPALAESAVRTLLTNDASFRRAVGATETDFKLSSQQTFGESRVDFVVEGTTTIVRVEVKNAVGADFIGTTDASC